MKILQLTSSLSMGGVTTVVSNLANELGNEHVVTIGCYRPQTKDIFCELNNISVVFYDGIFDYIADIRKNKYDVVHFHVMLKTGLLALLTYIFSRKSLIVSHSHSSSYTKNGLLFTVYRWISLILIRLFVKVRLACSELAGQYLYPWTSFIVIHNAIDARHFSFDARAREEIRRRFDLVQNYVVGFVGQFNDVKNLPFLIDVIDIVHRSCPEIALLMVGGPINDEISRLVKEKSYIHFAGLVNDSYLYYSAFDCFCLCSLWEGMPMVAIEAQANGLHCILSDSITTEVNIDGHVDFLPLNINQWVEHIVQLKNEVDKMSRCNVAIKTEFDIKVFGSKILSLYKC